LFGDLGAGIRGDSCTVFGEIIPELLGHDFAAVVYLFGEGEGDGGGVDGG
jgi:hypothetical protein